MGTALLLAYAERGDEVSAEDFDRVVECHPRRLREMPVHRLAGEQFCLAVWTDSFAKSPGLAEHTESGSWLALIGNPTRPDLSTCGSSVVDRMLDECLQRGIAAVDDVSPPFAAVFHDGRARRTYAAVDRFGFQHLYLRCDTHHTVWLASAGLALARALPSTLDHEAAAEWLAMGHFMSDRTLFCETRKLRSGERIEVGPPARVISTWEPTAIGGSDATPRPRAVERFTDAFLKSVEACAVGPQVVAELTGGIDSRLLLAALLSDRSSVMAWTQAQESWAELKIIERLGSAAEFDHFLAVVDESFVDILPSLVDEMTELSDGETNALLYAPLLVGFGQLEQLRQASLSGVAGEIARGFYFGLLRSDRQNRGVPIDALVNKETRPAAALRHCFNREFSFAPVEVLKSVVERFVEGSPGSSPEAILEDLYIRARLQRFAGRNFSTTGYFCRQGLPYFGHEFVDVVLALPFSTKTDGWVVRQALVTLNPKLAAVPLNAGMAVAPASRLRPDRSVRRTLALGRRAATKYGGPMGRRLAGRGSEMIPWTAARHDQQFRRWVDDVLCAPEAETAEFLDRAVVQRVVERSFAGANLYALGLLVTLELTLRKARTRT